MFQANGNTETIHAATASVHLLGGGGPPVPLTFICQWLNAQQTTAYSPGSSMTSQPTNFFTALLLWASRRPSVSLLPLPKEARNTMMHRSSRWLSAVSERLKRYWRWKAKSQGEKHETKQKQPTVGVERLPASFLEERKLQGRPLQHGKSCYSDRTIGFAGEAAL